MANKVKKVTKPSAKTLLSTEIAYWKGKSKAAEEQNEALGDQVDGLQSEVEELDAAISEVYDHNDELEQRNDVLQSALVSFQETNDRLNETIDQKESFLNLADVIILAAGKFEEITSAKIADLEQENFHLTIQLAAAKDKVKDLESRPVFDVHQVFAKSYTNSYTGHSGEHRTATGKVTF